MVVVGVTGSFGSGKSEVARLFRSFGAALFDADRSARKATRKGKPIYRAIVKIFGPKYLAKNGQIDRKKLAGYVFRHPAELKKLNILTHPSVIFDCLDRIERVRRRQGVLVLDVPLLFESKMEELAGLTVVVKASHKNMIARAVKRGVPRELAERILASQWPIEKKARLADFVIVNDGTPAELKEKAKKIYREILETPDPRA